MTAQTQALAALLHRIWRDDRTPTGDPPSLETIAARLIEEGVRVNSPEIPDSCPTPPDALDFAWAEAQALPEAMVKGRRLFIDKSTPGQWYANIRHEKGYTVWYMPGETPTAALRELVRALNERRADLAQSKEATE